MPKLVKREWLPHTLRQMSGVSVFMSGVRNIALNHAVATFVVSNQPNGQHQANYWAITSWGVGGKGTAGKYGLKLHARLKF